MLDAVNVKVDRRVDAHEEVSDMSGRLDPRRPLSFVVPREPHQLVNVGYPLDRMAENENEDDGEAHFSQSYLVFLGAVFS